MPLHFCHTNGWCSPGQLQGLIEINYALNHEHANRHKNNVSSYNHDLPESLMTPASGLDKRARAQVIAGEAAQGGGLVGIVTGATI